MPTPPREESMQVSPQNLSGECTPQKSEETEDIESSDKDTSITPVKDNKELVSY